MNLTSRIKKLNKEMLQAIELVSRVSDKKNTSVYIVGGIVRDILLKRNNMDLDIAVDGDAIALAREIGKAGNYLLKVHERFGTATIEVNTNLHIDLASARKETYVKSGALPKVSRGSLTDDLLRRDFSINAMAISINKSSFGELLDECNGLHDLNAKKVRVLHAKSFLDDPTRILRAIRFEQRFSFRMERETLRLLKDALVNKKELNVKAPRYFAEFRKLLLEENPVKSLKRMYRLNAESFLVLNKRCDFSKIDRIVGQYALESFRSLKGEEPDRMVLIFMVLVEGESREGVLRFSKQFSLTKFERLALLDGLDSSAVVRYLSSKNVKRSELYYKLNKYCNEFIYYLKFTTVKKNVREYIDIYLNELRNIKLKIRGEDLKQVGCRSGEKIGRVLKRVLSIKIDQNIKTKTDELKLAKKLVQTSV